MKTKDMAKDFYKVCLDFWQTLITSLFSNLSNHVRLTYTDPFRTGKSRIMIHKIVKKHYGGRKIHIS